MIAKIGEKITFGRSKTLNHINLLKYHYLHTVVKDNLSKLAVVVIIGSSDKSENTNLAETTENTSKKELKNQDKT